MQRFLLDANVIIALLTPSHQHHDLARHWFASTVAVKETVLATDPIGEGAFIRYSIRSGYLPELAKEALTGLHRHPAWEFWPDDISYGDLNTESVRGHKQVTDTYLAALATQHGGTLATFDIALATRLPDSVTLITQ